MAQLLFARHTGSMPGRSLNRKEPFLFVGSLFLGIRPSRNIKKSDIKSLVCTPNVRNGYYEFQVSDEDKMNAIKAVFPFSDENYTYPCKLAFSNMVPKVYQQVKEYIFACHKFSNDLDVTQEAVNDMIRKSTTLLLTKTFSGSLSATFKKPGLGLLQVF